ncbi:ribosomal protein S18-alanine N-acetyltransferase [Stakelama sediminis]|uniref:Ribosomal-protein-alanine N-acetyltransferase n=1 Tax=Stakelama sediminis TaxID=463200 RepID=A0A840YXB8_9SPHN|nr:GNAT family N-acetyltransferase [Stakelama sediminis]MBB5718192.1 ribosomal-protein-alanine N-acetyltransferase [Stakelama sediminis]
MSTRLRIANIRPGGEGDIPTVNQIMADAFDPQYGEAWTPSQCTGILALPGTWLSIAVLDDQPAGFALSRAIFDDAELLLLAVRPAMRRHGVGGALLRSVIQDCLSRGVETLHLEVRANNPATSLYHREGFTKVGERPKYYCGMNGKLFDAHSFRCKLMHE